MRPAWSWQFQAPHLGAVASMRLPAPVTAEWAWGEASGAGVKVAVVDSGIDPGHPLVGRVAGGVRVGYSRDDAAVHVVEEPHDDLFGHGTACGAIIRRSAPDVELYSVRVLGENLSGKGEVFAAGLEWAIRNGMQVVNLSLSTKKREHFARFHALVDEASFRGLMLVAAVNNVDAPSYPSLYAGVFSVAAHDGDDPLDIRVNPTPPVEFGAPGIDLEVAWLGGTTVRATGNSFAAPHVTGLVARILSKHPEMTPYEMKSVLRALASNATKK